MLYLTQKLKEESCKTGDISVDTDYGNLESCHVADEQSEVNSDGWRPWAKSVISQSQTRTEEQNLYSKYDQQWLHLLIV